MQAPMNDDYREEVITALVLLTGWNRQAFDKMDDEELQRKCDEMMNHTEKPNI